MKQLISKSKTGMAITAHSLAIALIIVFQKKMYSLK